MLETDRDYAEKKGFAVFNRGTHLCVDVPNGNYTVSCRLSNGKLVTFAFVPYQKDGPADCIDIHHKTGKPITGYDRIDDGSIRQNVICFSGGTDAFRSDAKDARPVTLTCLLLTPAEVSDA
jgi:hypothetical protein